MKNLLILFFTFFGLVYGVAQSTIFDIARKGTLPELKEFYSKFPESINTSNDQGFSPLTLACYHGNNKVAKFLAEHTNNIDSISSFGTPLMAAVVKSNKEMVIKLLELNANPNIADSNKTTALHYAVMFKLPEIVKLLINKGASISEKDGKGFSPLDYASRQQNPTIYKLLKS